MQPSGRSTQRTSRESLCATAAFDARACSGERRHAAAAVAVRPMTATTMRRVRLRQSGLVVKDESV
jgi:hypothetical protein